MLGTERLTGGLRCGGQSEDGGITRRPPEMPRSTECGVRAMLAQWPRAHRRCSIAHRASASLSVATGAVDPPLPPGRPRPQETFEPVALGHIRHGCRDLLLYCIYGKATILSGAVAPAGTVPFK